MVGETLKVMIVDDEYLVRNLLKKCIRWEDYGICIGGEASNAKEALALVDEIRPDLIFTDICMPQIDGIEFSKLVIEKYPYTKIVVLTGHDDFEYAQRSIKVGISDFILKPIDNKEIKKVITVIKKKIEEEKEQRVLFNKLKEQENDSKSLDNKNDTKIISQIQNYMNQNMASSDLSLAGIAKKYHINSSYLSRLFKMETGVNFIDYLTKIRIEKAIKLLQETDMKGYQVGEYVGIHDPHYFSICFKKFTGISLKDCKKNKY